MSAIEFGVDEPAELGAVDLVGEAVERPGDVYEVLHEAVGAPGDDLLGDLLDGSMTGQTVRGPNALKATSPGSVAICRCSAPAGRGAR